MKRLPRALPLRAAAALALLASSAASALAQLAHRPFEVGGGEGGAGASGGLTGWLLAEQSQLTHLIAIQVKALHSDPTAIWGLVGIGFAYGVFHAAGPGHGKAVIASYMMANDRALRRGVVLAFLAALLQGAVAVALVGIAALIFNATSSEMNRAADGLALASYAGIIAIGIWLVWTKGRALIAALRALFARRATVAGGALYQGAPWRRGRTETAKRRFAPTRRARRRSNRPCADTRTPPTRPRSGRPFPGAARSRRCSRRGRDPVRGPFWCSSSRSRSGCSWPGSPQPSPCRWARR